MLIDDGVFDNTFKSRNHITDASNHQSNIQSNPANQFIATDYVSIDDTATTALKSVRENLFIGLITIGLLKFKSCQIFS